MIASLRGDNRGGMLSIWYAFNMPDTSSHVATRPDAQVHTVPLAELEAIIVKAGIVMSRRQITRHCESGTFDAVKLPAVDNIEHWYVAPASIENGIADIKALRALRDSHVETRPDATGHDTPPVQPKEPPNDYPVMSRRDETRPDMSNTEMSPGVTKTQPDTSRHVETPDIFEHPYVKRLEAQVEKWEGKYHEQVRRTEDIQMKSTQQILELQRMTAIGQSETLANFMLKARDWIIGQGSEMPDKSGLSDAPPA
jgi:hypothetical protein